MGFNEFVLNHELPIRLGFFFAVFAVMALWEVPAPRRRLQRSRTMRWTNNLGLVFQNSFLVRYVFPAAAVGMALQAGERGWGLFPFNPLNYAIGLTRLKFIHYLIVTYIFMLPGAALAENLLVRVHLLDDDVQVGCRGQRVPETAVDLKALLTELIDCGLEVRACGMALEGCGIDESAMIKGIERGSMKALATWVKDSDHAMVF